MIKSKKLLLSLGLVAVASAPVIVTVSCGSTDSKDTRTESEKVRDALQAKITNGKINSTSKDKADVKAVVAEATAPTITNFDTKFGTDLFASVDTSKVNVNITKSTGNAYSISIADKATTTKSTPLSLTVEPLPLPSTEAPLDLTASSTTKVTQMREVFALIYGTATLNTGGYDFLIKPTGNTTPLEWFMKKSQVETVRAAVFDPNMPIVETDWDDFISMMKDATGSAFGPGEQFVITSMEEEGLDLTFGGTEWTVAQRHQWLIDKFMGGAMPSTIGIKESRPAATTNNIEVDFVKGTTVGGVFTPAVPEVKETVQFNCKNANRNSGESDDAYTARIDALNANRQTKFEKVIQSVKVEYRTFSKKVETLFDEMKKSGVTSNAVARTVISAMLDLSYDFITGKVPVYTTMKAIPGVGALIGKVDNSIKGKFIPPTSNWIADKLFPTTLLAQDLDQIYFS